MKRLNIERRELGTLVVVGFAPGIVLLLLSLLGSPGEGLFVFWQVSKFSLPITLLIGLPAIYLLNRTGRYRLINYIGVGAVVALALGALLILPAISRDPELLGMQSYIAQFAVLAFLSAATCVTYWLIVRPDRLHT